MIGPDRLTDGVVALRELREADVPQLVEGANDPVIPLYTRVPSPYTEEHARSAVGPVDDEIRRAIVDADDDARLLGVISLLRFAADGRSCEVGYWLAAWARGRGTATRAVELLCEWGFDALGLDHVELHAHTENAASRGVARRAGFAEAGAKYEEDGRELVIYARSSSTA